MGKKFTIYKTTWCPYCDYAKKLINNLMETNKNIELEEINAEGYPELFQEVIKETGRTTVPQIYLDDHYIGGWDDLNEASQNGKLAELLND